MIISTFSSLYLALQGRWELLASSFLYLKKLRSGQLFLDPQKEGGRPRSTAADSLPAGSRWFKVETP